jgi:hypothetical protein
MRCSFRGRYLLTEPIGREATSALFRAETGADGHHLDETTPRPPTAAPPTPARHQIVPPPAPLAYVDPSRTTSLGSLLARTPLYEGCRSFPSEVQCTRAIGWPVTSVSKGSSAAR